MPNKKSLLIEDEDLNAETGQRSFRVRIIEEDKAGNRVAQGPLVTHGISLEALEGAFGGSLKKFLEGCKKKMLLQYRSLREKDDEARSLKGKKL